MQPPSLSSHQTFSWPPHKGSTVPTKQFLIAPHPQPWQLLTCVLSAWINLFWMFHICGIHLQQVTFCVWLLSPCVTFSRSMYFVDCYRYVFPLCSWMIFHCRHTPQCVNFFVHWWAFGGIHKLAVMKNAVMDIWKTIKLFHSGCIILRSADDVWVFQFLHILTNVYFLLF